MQEVKKRAGKLFHMPAVNQQLRREPSIRNVKDHVDRTYNT